MKLLLAPIIVSLLTALLPAYGVWLYRRAVYREELEAADRVYAATEFLRVSRQQMRGQP